MKESIVIIRTERTYKDEVLYLRIASNESGYEWTTQKNDAMVFANMEMAEAFRSSFKVDGSIAYNENRVTTEDEIIQSTIHLKGIQIKSLCVTKGGQHYLNIKDQLIKITEQQFDNMYETFNNNITLEEH